MFLTSAAFLQCNKAPTHLNHPKASTSDFRPQALHLENDEINDSQRSSTNNIKDESQSVPTVKKLNWKFYGLTLWLELEEFECDVTNAIQDFAVRYGTENIPKSHTTAIYGMTHLTVEEAIKKLHLVKKTIPSWPRFASPVGVLSDVETCEMTGQAISWCELTLASDDAHEKALDILYSIFSKDGIGSSGRFLLDRQRPWTPHTSLAYGNPEDAIFSLQHLKEYVANQPSLVTSERRVEAISLWDMNGRMEDWKCLDRVYF